MSVSLTIDTSQFKTAMDRLPRVVNAELNRGMYAIANGFYDRFKHQLRGRPGIKVQRKVVSGRGNRRVPPEAKAMGFTARLAPRNEIAGKTMTLWSRNPVMHAHEFGAVIRPRRGPFLILRDRSGVSMGALQKSNATGRILARVRSVTIPARLGFYRTWYSYQSEAQARIDKVARGIEKRVEGASRVGSVNAAL